jgi:hypothetical protein
MRKLQVLAAVTVIGGSMAFAQAQAAPPPAPTTQPDAKTTLDNMLRPTTADSARPLQPMTTPIPVDKTTGAAAVAPGAQPLNVLREGSYIVDRTGRLTRGADGQSWEFTLEADNQAMKDPPLVVLPNLKLMLMEDQIKETRRDLKFRVTGMITEYRGRNYVMFVKFIVLSD